MASVAADVDLGSQARPREGSSELRIQAMSHRNAISWMT